MRTYCQVFRKSGWSVRAKALLTCLALCWSAQAHAQNCADLYGAIKQEAMYCGFFCDQQKLLPLQLTYEAECITVVVPMSLLPFDPLPEQLETSENPAEKAVRAVVPRDDTPSGSFASDQIDWELTWLQRSGSSEYAHRAERSE